MSNWDFGYSREPADPRKPQYPGHPDAEGWPRHDGDPYDPQAAPYPLTYERDDFDGRQSWSTGPQQAGPRRAAPRPTSPGRAVPPRPATRQTGPWQPGYAGAQPGYADGQPGYDGRPGYAGAQRGVPYEEPWPDDSRGAQLDGPWWDPDSWPDWRRWLIPVGVAVLAAAIGAALVLLTGMHTGASAAAGAPLPLIAASTFTAEHSGLSRNDLLDPC